MLNPRICALLQFMIMYELVNLFCGISLFRLFYCLLCISVRPKIFTVLVYVFSDIYTFHDLQTHNISFYHFRYSSQCLRCYNVGVQKKQITNYFIITFIIIIIIIINVTIIILIIISIFIITSIQMLNMLWLHFILLFQFCNNITDEALYAFNNKNQNPGSCAQIPFQSQTASQEAN